jgi:cell division protein ZapB
VLDDEIRKLEERVSTLVGLCKRLREENSSLRGRERDLTEVNAALVEKNRLARTRIEAIIGKLKMMDPGTFGRSDQN